MINGCRLVVGKNGQVHAEDLISPTEMKQLPIDLQNLINEDKKYGVIKPNKEGWITWRVYDHDTELNLEEVDAIVRIALYGWQRKLKVKFRPARPNEEPILKIHFTDPEHDPNMHGSTLAYHYYPMMTNEHHGECWINRTFFFTINGKSLNMHFIDPVHYPDANTNVTGKTYDLDRVLRHEFGHGIFGLQHDGKDNTTMSAIYTHISDMIDDRTVTRACAKGYDRRTISDEEHEKRLEKWYIAKADELPIWTEQ